MINKKVFLFCIFILVVAGLVNAATNIQLYSGDLGYEIEYPKFNYVKENEDFKLRIHIFNKSTGKISNTTLVNCSLVITNQSGNVIVESQLNQNTGRDYFSYNISKGNFTAGKYEFLMYCRDTGGGDLEKGDKFGGFVSGRYEVTKTGDAEEPTGDSNLSLVFFLMVVIISLFAIPIKEKKLFNNPITNFIFRRGCWALALSLLLMTTAIIATIVQTSGLGVTREVFRIMWIVGKALWVMLIWLVFGTLIQTVKYWKEQVKHKRMGDEDDQKINNM